MLTKTRFREAAACAAFGMLLASAPADVIYKVEVKPDEGLLHVTMTMKGTGKGSHLQIPNWGPGGYRLNDGFKTVKNLTAKDQAGNDLKIDQVVTTLSKTYTENGVQKVSKDDVCTWNVAPARETIVQYDVPTQFSDGSVHWSGPRTYIYETGHRLEKCILQARPPQGWPVYVGLDEIKEGSNDFVAKNYDTFADNPVSTGDLTVDTYESRGKKHYIVMRGEARKNVDRAKLLKACKFVSDIETDFFGDSAPYSKYVWHFAVNGNADGAGGLEHLSSTEITLAQGVGPRAKDVLAHEFFHLWNVKRIRSKPLGPFDYTKLPETGAIWWLEGVTDYYAYTLPHRYKGTTDAEYLAAIASNLNAVRNSPGYLLVGPYESSMRVDEASEGRGNSNGYLISYYNLGWLAGMCLDIEMRAHTKGKHTLDDVEHALWDLCKNDKPGFAEDEIRKQLVRFGGPEMGEVYDRVVMKPNGMAIEQTLAKVGLQVQTKPQEYVDNGFGIGGFGGGAVTIANVHGPAEGKLQNGDILLMINGNALGQGRGPQGGGGAVGRELRDSAAGKPIKLQIKRGDDTMDVEVTPVTATRDTYTVEKIANPDKAAEKLGAEWLATKDAKED